MMAPWPYGKATLVCASTALTLPACATAVTESRAASTVQIVPIAERSNNSADTPFVGPNFDGAYGPPIDVAENIRKTVFNQ